MPPTDVPSIQDRAPRSVVVASSRWLTETQNPDGGWASVPGRSSGTEATSIALLALRRLKTGSATSSAERAVEWLRTRQHPDGSWPVGDRVPHPSWATSVAALALAETGTDQRQLDRASAWLMRQEGARSWLSRLVHLVAPQTMAVRMNPNLRGWPWMSGTASFVEPTAYALLAFRKMASGRPGDEVAARIQEAEAMLYDRMCTGGGWNYGNTQVYDEVLAPFADTTALALIALHRHAAAAPNRQSLDRLPQLMASAGSGLSVAWGTLCLELYGQDVSAWTSRLAARYSTTETLGGTKAVALVLLALTGGATVFRT